jgi:LmbE family N-acetylglucosaminyl deacetylase
VDGKIKKDMVICSMDQESVLVVGAHPDDVDFATAGTMLKWAREGKNIYYVICTNGNKGGSSSDYSPDELAIIRKEEQQTAASKIGAKYVYFLGYNDGELTADYNLKRDIVRVIRLVRPRYVFAFDPANLRFDNFYLFHTDHRACGLATFDAIYPAASNRLYFPELLQQWLLPYRVPEVYFYGSAEPNFWCDISDVMDEKIEVLRCHKSQFNNEKASIVEDYMRKRNKLEAQNFGCKYAEAFRRLLFPF